MNARTKPPGEALDALRQALRWALLILPLELGWEIVQLPLYQSWRTKSASALSFDVLHCTAGDVLIAFTTYLAAALTLRAPRWPLASPVRGAAVAISLGIAYTIASERYHLRAGHWAYAQLMPVMAGIGAAPLLQWLLIPLAALLWYRSAARRHGC